MNDATSSNLDALRSNVYAAASAMNAAYGTRSHDAKVTEWRAAVAALAAASPKVERKETTFRGSYDAAWRHFGCSPRKVPCTGILHGSVSEWTAR